MEYWLYGLGLLGGILAGIINTLAGNGSSITLYLLMDVFAVPPNIANGTNRLGMVTQGIGSLPTFYRNGHLNLKRDAPLLILMTIGAVFGIIVATNIDPAQFKSIFKYLLLLMLGVVLVKPERWLRQSDGIKKIPFILLIPICVALGFYGGFIQMGMGIFLLMFLVLGASYNLMDGNALKNAVTVLYTSIAICFFAYYGLIDWKFGGILAAGQYIGGNLAARFATRYESASLWSYRLLVAVSVFAVVRLFISG
jgi:uncharacterized membrane protein YfcA